MSHQHHKVDIYRTNEGLGYNQWGYYVKISDGYFCIDCTDKAYKPEGFRIGEIHEINEKYLEVCEDYKLSSSPIYNQYLFDILLCSIRIAKENGSYVMYHDGKRTPIMHEFVSSDLLTQMAVGNIIKDMTDGDSITISKKKSGQ